MDAQPTRLNQQMSYQQHQFLLNSRNNHIAVANRNHYSNRQIDQSAPSTVARGQAKSQGGDKSNSKLSSGSGSENEEQNQLSGSLSTRTTIKTNSSQQAMLSHNNKTSPHQQLLQHQQQQQQKRYHQQQMQQQQQHRQQALQAQQLSNLTNPGKPNNFGPNKQQQQQSSSNSADNMTTSSSSDHTIDDLHQLASGYHHSRLTGSSRFQAADADAQAGGRFLLGILFTLAELLLFTTILLWLYWSYQHDDGLAWQNDRKQQFNTHAALMLFGFVFLNGQAMLIYRSFQCCDRIYTKILHTIIFVLATSAISLGLILAYTAQENVGANNKPIMHFYSLHAWCGLITVGLFVLQFVFGFVSFLILLCCDHATSKFRAALLPIHKTFGLIIFSLAIATSLMGLLQTARSRLR